MNGYLAAMWIPGSLLEKSLYMVYTVYYKMDGYVKKLIFAVLFSCCALALFAQQNTPPGMNVPDKFALVIGNGAYTGLTRLANPVNDANDVAEVLEEIGFSVDKVLDGNLEQMEAAIVRLQDCLSQAPDSYGFFFYAGHGVQSGGENFLIPVDANIPTESFLKNRSVSVQAMLDELNYARNSLNVVVLDACRDNPFGWGRSSYRGLATITRQPADSIIVYATSAGQQAKDGVGRNGLFTSQLLDNLATPGLEVIEVFRRTGAAVSLVSNNQQIPAIYSQFFGTAYLSAAPDGLAAGYIPTITRPAPQPLPSSPGQVAQDKNKAAHFWSVGASLGSSFAAPWILGTVHGTIAPFKYSFLELGFDAGLVSGVTDVGFYSLCPFAHYAYYLPVNRVIAWYAGAGGGYIFASYGFPEGDVKKNDFVLDAVTGFNILGMIDVSYTLRTNLSGILNKVSVGYTYRFK